MMAASVNWIINISLWLTIVIVGKYSTEARSSPNLETNEIVVDERIPSMPLCQRHSICGFLQANARGINQERLCACESGLSSCPMTWDPVDGHSITQGSDQYKTCGPAPKDVETCKPLQTAYTSRTVYYKSTEEIITKGEYVSCICPEGHNYVPGANRFDDLDEDTESMEFTYVCAPLPICQSGDPCKAITIKGSHFLVNRKCQCPGSQRCPTLSHEEVESTPFGKGHFQLVRCQH